MHPETGVQPPPIPDEAKLARQSQLASDRIDAKDSGSGVKRLIDDIVGIAQESQGARTAREISNELGAELRAQQRAAEQAAAAAKKHTAEQQLLQDALDNIEQ